MTWLHGGHQVQHLMNELVAKAHIEDLKRHSDKSGPLREVAAGRQRPSIFRRTLRRIRGGGD